MALVDDILAGLSGDAPVREARVGLRATAIWSRRLGLAYAFPRAPDARAAGAAPRPPRLVGQSARGLAERLRSTDPEDASLGMAALNSLLEPPAQGLRDGNAFDLVRARAPGRRVAVIGHFPTVDALRALAGQLWVLELEPRGDDLPARRAAEILPAADVVAITGTTLINHTLEGLLELARGKYVVLLGPSAPLSPALFEHGVAAIGGALVDAPEAALATVSEGASFRQVDGLRRVVWERG